MSLSFSIFREIMLFSNSFLNEFTNVHYINKHHSVLMDLALSQHSVLWLKFAIKLYNIYENHTFQSSIIKTNALPSEQLFKMQRLEIIFQLLFNVCSFKACIFMTIGSKWNQTVGNFQTLSFHFL